MAPYAIVLSLFLACLSPFCLSYGIDASCKPGSNDGLIYKAAESAFDMASQALEAISADARDPNVERLLDLLFRGGSQYRTDPGDANLIQQIRNVYIGMAKFAHKRKKLAKSRDDPSASDQVNIFCNLARVQKHSNTDQVVDMSTGMVLEDVDVDELNTCENEKRTLAFTWNPFWNEDDDGSRTYYPSQITLCPWFFEWAVAKKRMEWSDVGRQARVAKYAIPVATQGWPFTEIDAVQLLDKVLLHEFTHTVAAGLRTDVEMEHGAPPGFNGLAYGWKAGITLAKQQNVKDSSGQYPQTDKRPVMNADSYALFASGVKLLNNPQGPTFIKNNGRITSKRQHKRALPAELQYKRTPAAFEGFVTSIRAQQAAATAAERA